MGKYLIEGNYTAEGVKGLLKEGGSGRKAAVEAALKGLGGSLESFYYALGDTDVFVIVDAPDNVTVTALALGVASTGLVEVRTTVLMTVDEVDEATKKTVSYRGPGR